jgi:hypothetical protein
MIRPPRMPRKRVHDDAGSSLAEVLITMMIGMLLLGIVMDTVVSGQRLSRQQSTRSQNTNDAGTAMDAATKSIRTALPTCDSAVPTTCSGTALAISTGSNSTSLTFYAAVGNSYTGSGASEVAALPGPKKVRLYVDASGQLFEEMSDPALFPATPPQKCCAYTAPSSSRVLARNVVATITGDAPGQLFTYFHKTTNAVLPVPLSAADAAEVGRIRVDLLVQGTSSPSVPGTRISTTVVLPNVGV